MRIAVVVPCFPCLSETFILNQIVEFVKMGHDVTIYAMSKPANSILHQDYIKYRINLKTKYVYSEPRRKFCLRIKAVWLSLVHLFESPKLFGAGIIRMLFSNSEPFDYKKLFLFFLLGSQKQDVFFCHFGPMGEAAAYLKSLGLPGHLVTMFHGYDIRMAVSEARQKYEKLFRYADVILANSEYTRHRLFEFGSFPEKTKFTPLGLDTDKFSKDSQYSANAKDKIVILTVCRLVEEKGLSYGISAFAEVVKNSSQEVFFYILGDGPLRDSLEQQALSLGLKERVVFWGCKTQEELLEFYKEADIFFLPSITEAFGLVLLEAQAMQLPIVATRIGGIPEALVENDSAFLVQSCDINAMAEKILYLINNPEIRLKMGRAGRLFVERNYEINESNKKLIEILEEVIRGKIKALP